MFKNFKPGATTRVAAFLLLASSTLPGVDFGALRPQGYVNDFAGVLDFAAKTQIERYCGVVERQTGAQMSLVILDTLAGEPVEDVANTLFRKWGIGQKGKNEGILLLIVVKDRRSRLEVGYGLEPILPDGFSGSVLRSMRESLRRSDYSSAMLAAANEIGTRIAQAKGVSLTDRIARPAPANDSSDIPWPFIIGGIILLLLFVLSNRGGGRSGGGRGGGGGSWLPWMIMSQMGGGGRGSYGGGGGGGFGGGDSGGGGFGGFGGDSGGGGASSDW